MKILSNLFFNWLKRKKTQNQNKDNRQRYIFYKIIDLNLNTTDEYILQCINTKALFKLNLFDLVFDIDLLYSLHPIQACYIGMEYALRLKEKKEASTLSPKQQKQFQKHSVGRYGHYTLVYQNREGNIGFQNKTTSKEFLMNPLDVALSEDLISEFDAAQAFYIGYLAGMKINPTPKKNSRPSYLRIVK